MTDLPADGYIALLERQGELVGSLRELSRRQASLIERGEAEALLELIAARQRVLDRFVESQERLGRLDAAMRRSGSGVPGASRARARVLIESIGAGLGEVLRQDEADRARLAASRRRAAPDLQEAGARALNGRFRDRKGAT